MDFDKVLKEIRKGNLTLERFEEILKKLKEEGLVTLEQLEGLKGFPSPEELEETEKFLLKKAEEFSEQFIEQFFEQTFLNNCWKKEPFKQFFKSGFELGFLHGIWYSPEFEGYINNVKKKVF